jgi:hypothetical protein
MVVGEKQNTNLKMASGVVVKVVIVVQVTERKGKRQDLVLKKLKEK